MSADEWRLFGRGAPVMAYSFVNATYSGSGILAGFVISAGQQLIIEATDIGAPASTLTLSDGTNTYVSRGSVQEVRDGIISYWFDCLAPTPGTYTISVVGATTPLITAYRYTGLGSYSAGSFASHDYNTASPPTTSDGITTTAITPTSYPAAVIGIIPYATGANTLFAAGAGFTKNDGRNTSPCEIEEDIRLLSGSNIASFTMTTGGSSVLVMGAAYLETTFNPALLAPYVKTTWFVTDTVVQM
jgi:uncharacterized protein YlzI (FlbEa/FlbD family)